MKSAEREHEQRAWLAWHIAALPKMKKFPRLRDLISRRKGDGKPKTPDQLLAIARQWNAAINAPRRPPARPAPRPPKP